MDDQHESVSLHEAAERLGLSLAALRKRLQRGSIAGHKGHDGAWRVALPTGDSGPRHDVGRGVGRDTTAPPMLDGALALVYDRLIESKDAEILFLREQLRTRDEEIRRRDVILAQVTTKPAELAPAASTESPPAPAEPPATRAWWRRLLGR